MAEGYPIADIYAERHMETIDRKIENCHRLIDESLNLMQNPRYLQSCLSEESQSLSKTVEIGDFFQEFSRQISIFALENYMHDVVTPGVPDFQTPLKRLQFWSCVCTQKLLSAKKYLGDDEYNTNASLLDLMWLLLRTQNNEIQRVYSWPPL